MVAKRVLPNSKYKLDKKATGGIFFQNPDALHELIARWQPSVLKSRLHGSTYELGYPA
jgi:hypothetical protein